jgi:chemotaxis family two-component system sensor kinase Cph1
METEGHKFTTGDSMKTCDTVVVAMVLSLAQIHGASSTSTNQAAVHELKKLSLEQLMAVEVATVTTASKQEEKATEAPATVIDIVIDTLTATIQGTGTVVTYDRPLPTINGDRTQLIQLFQNLIGNAIKFRRQDEPPRIHVGVQRKQTEWEFSIRDNGIGIDPQYYQRIFVIFQRLHRHEEYPGTGIGLALCKKIVERHGGHIGVDSTPGKGSTFHFTLPPNGDNQT